MCECITFLRGIWGVYATKVQSGIGSVFDCDAEPQPPQH